MDKLPRWITNYLIGQNIVVKEEEEIYFYSFKVVFLIVSTVMLIAALSLYFNCLLESMVFLVFLAPLRTYAGGYHAGSPWICLALYVVLNFGAVGISRIIPSEGSIILMMAALPVSMLIIVLLAPVAAQNKPLSEEEIKNYRKISIVIGLLECFLLLLIFGLFGKMPEIYLNGTLGVLIAAISIAAEKIRINLEGGDLSYEIKREL